MTQTEQQKPARSRQNRTLTRAELAEVVYQKVGLSRTKSAELVEMLLFEIKQTLERGELVKLTSFGSFEVRSKRERIGRNPKTGVEVPITPRRILVFKPSDILKSVINGTQRTKRKRPSRSGEIVDRQPA